MHVVLTLRSADAPLAEQLTRLYKSASKMRNSKWWKSHATGGMAAVEVTRSEQTSLWHPHLHILVHADWLDQKTLSEEWLKATGDSSIVHVSLVEKTEAAVREVTKYVAKPIHRSIDFHADALQELIRALHGRHLLVTFGSWRKDPLLKESEEAPEGTWKFWGTLHTLHGNAALGDQWAINALKFLSSKIPGRAAAPAPGVPPSG
jgi:hypothetical protein